MMTDHEVQAKFIGNTLLFGMLIWVLGLLYMYIFSQEDQQDSFVECILYCVLGRELTV